MVSNYLYEKLNLCSSTRHVWLQLQNSFRLILVELMAATLSASLTSNSALPQRKSCQPSRVFYNPRCRNIPFSYSFSHCKNIVKFSLRRTGVVVSAISGSPGESNCSSRYGFSLVIAGMWFMKCGLQELDRMWRVGTLQTYWNLWRCLTWTAMEFRFPISGKIGKLLLHLPVILGTLFEFYIIANWQQFFNFYF